MKVRRYRFYGDARAFTSTVLLAVAIAGFVGTSAKADDKMRSSPPDTKSYSRPLVPEDLTLGKTAGTAGQAAGVNFSVVDTVVNNTNPNLQFTDAFNDGETSIAVNPLHQNEIVITAFFGCLGCRRTALVIKKRGRNLDERVYDQPATRGRGRARLPM